MNFLLIQRSVFTGLDRMMCSRVYTNGYAMFLRIGGLQLHAIMMVTDLGLGM